MLKFICKRLAKYNEFLVCIEFWIENSDKYICIYMCELKLAFEGCFYILIQYSAASSGNAVWWKHFKDIFHRLYSQCVD